MAEKYLLDRLENANTIEKKREALANLNGFFKGDVYKFHNGYPQWYISAHNVFLLMDFPHDVKNLWIDIALSKGKGALLIDIATDVYNSF